MECDNLHFVNLTRNDYVWKGGQEKFWSISSPLLEMIQHKLKGNYLYAEEFFIKFLQRHRTTISIDDVAILSRHMSTCIFHAYVLAIAMILSVVVGIPLVCCTKTCHKKISKSKNQYCLFAEGVILFMALCFLCIGAVSDWHLGITAQRLLDKFPAQTRQILEDYDHTVQSLNQDGEILRGNVTAVVDFAVLKVATMPKSISIIARDHCGFSATQTLLFDNLTAYLKKLSQSLDTLRDKDNNRPELPKIFNQTLNDTTISDTSALDLREHFSDDLKSDLSYTSERKLPNRGEKMSIGNFDAAAILHKMVSDITGKHKAELKQKINEKVAVLRSLMTRMRRAQNLSVTSTKAMTQGMDALIPGKVKYSIANATSSIEWFVRATSFSRDQSTIFSKGTTWMFLAPSLFGFTVFLLLVAALSGMYREYHNVSQGKILTAEHRNVPYRIVVAISITFLWLILLMALASYILHIPLAVLCGSIKKDALFSRYLDQNLWNNDTWLSYKLKDLLPVSRSLKVQNVLSGCSRNETLFSCLGLERTDKERVGFNNELQCFENDVTRELAGFFDEITAHLDKIGDKLNLETTLPLNGRGESPVNESYRLRFFGGGGGDGDEVVEELKLNVNSSSKDHQMLEIKFLVDSAKDHLERLKSLMVQKKNETTEEVARYFSEISKALCSFKKAMDFVEDSLLHTIGKCSILSYAYSKLTWMTCDWFLPLLATWWIALSMTAFSTIVALLLTCKLRAQVQGVLLIFLQRQRISSFGRYSNRQVALPVPPS